MNDQETQELARIGCATVKDAVDEVVRLRAEVATLQGRVDRANGDAIKHELEANELKVELYKLRGGLP